MNYYERGQTGRALHEEPDDDRDDQTTTTVGSSTRPPSHVAALTGPHEKGTRRWRGEEAGRLGTGLSTHLRAPRTYRFVACRFSPLSTVALPGLALSVSRPPGAMAVMPAPPHVLRSTMRHDISLRENLESHWGRGVHD